MNFSGQWQDAEKPGTGISIQQHADGKLTAWWFGFDRQKRPIFLAAVGSANTGTMKTWAPWMSSDGVVHEDEFGYFIVHADDANHIFLEYEPSSNSNVDDFVLRMKPWYTPAPVPAPTPAPEPVPPPSNLPRVVIRNQQGHDTGGRATGAGDLNLPRTTTIEVLEGSLTISNVATWGDWRPTITGVRKGQILKPGPATTVICDVDAAHREQNSGNYGEASFQVDSKELGNLIQLTAHVEKP